MKKKSIVSSFGDFTSQSVAASVKPKDDSESPSDRAKSRVGAGIIGATKRSLTELREERDQLLASVKEDDVVLNIDPGLIDPSPFADRLPDDGDEDFLEFKCLLEEQGQIVPITVRQNPQDGTRYQVVYGHRRCRALSQIGRQAKAIVRDYSDRELAIAQGIENASRQDLSWIEKALFAATMERSGLKAKDIRAALSVDDAQLSNFRAVYKALGEELIQVIGRAPKVGRPRWLDLIAQIKSKGDVGKINETLSADKVSNLPSNERFAAAMKALIPQPVDAPSKQSPKVRKLGAIGEAKFSERNIRISLTSEHAASFSEFLDEEMDDLLAKFEQRLKD